MEAPRGLLAEEGPSVKVPDEGLAREGSRRRFRTKAWLEKVLDEGPGRRPG